MRTDNRVRVKELPVGTWVKFDPDGHTWIIKAINGDRVSLEGCKIRKYVDGDKKMFVAEKENNI